MSDSNTDRNHQVPPAIQNVIESAVDYTFQTSYDMVTMDHLSYVIINGNEYVQKVLKEIGADAQKLSENLHNYIKANSPNVPCKKELMQYSDEVVTLLSEVPVHVTSKGRNLNDIKWVDIFYLITINTLNQIHQKQPPKTAIEQMLHSNPQLCDAIIQYIDQKAQDGDFGSGDESDFITDFTKLAAEGKLDPVIGRATEIQEMTEVLARKKKNNIMLLGKPGVGKTAVVEGIANAIHNGDCHKSIASKRILNLDVAGMLAGTKYRGEFEERARETLQKLCEDGDAIVFIDEAHTVIGAGASTQGGVDLANIMKPMLARGDLMCIAATTYDEYKENIEKDKAMVRRFQNYTVEEPDETATKIILEKIMPVYEEYHGVKYDGIIDTLISNCERYIQNRAFPDKAIDILDAAGAYSKINEFDTVDDSVIVKIVSRMSNVPEQAIKKSETEVFENLGDEIKKNLYGQDHVIETIVEEVMISKSGMVENNKPIGTFLLSGTTGVGKTELARQLSDGLNIPLIKYDMSEYQEQHSVAKLIGAPPGYVGYDENSAKLIDDVENNPNCVLLLDEIEKAHSRVLSILLQIMDDGKLTSSQGKTVNFNNVVILMTTNLGAKEKNKGSIGYVNTTNNTADKRAVEEFFSPEFLNRLSVGTAISFNNLSHEDMRRIVTKEIDRLNTLMSESGVVINVDDKALDRLAEEGYEPTMGARPLQRVIKDDIKKPLSKEVVFGKLKDGGTANVTVNGDDFEFQYS